MKKQMTAGLLSLSLAFSGLTAAPAHADTNSDKAAALLLGFAALVGIAKTMENRNPPQQYTRQPAPQAYYPQPQYRRPPAAYHPPVQKGYGKKAAALPVQCLQRVRSQGGSRNVFTGSCLDRSGLRANLPRSCAIDLRGPNGRQDAYDASCLLQKGYVIGSLRR